jgi:hypothetical protein
MVCHVQIDGHVLTGHSVVPLGTALGNILVASVSDNKYMAVHTFDAVDADVRIK